MAGAKFGPKGKGYWRYNQVSRKISSQYAADDYAGGMIRFENGTGLQVESFWASHQPEEFQIEIFGDEAGAQLRPLTLYRTENNAPQNIEVKIPHPAEAWDNIAAHFIECILDGKPCDAPPRTDRSCL